MARLYQGERTFLTRLLAPLERLIYRLLGVDPQEEMSWKTYAVALLLFNLAGFLFLYLLLRLQHSLPLNPLGLGSVAPGLAFNIAVSFATNTNWQSYSGETTLSLLSQMLGLTVQNFLSAATGMAVLIAFIRGLVRHSSRQLGNFWVDLTRSTLYILLPLALILSLVLVSQGVVQTFQPTAVVQTLDPSTGQKRKPCRWIRLPPRSPSNSWAPMVAVISISTRPTRSRIRHPFPTSWRCLPSCSSRLH